MMIVNLEISNTKAIKQKKSNELAKPKQELQWRPVVNFTSILRAAFAPDSFCQKNTNLSRKYKKPAQNAFVRKSCS